MFVDITRYWGAKFAALEIYRSEMRDTPHARSFQGLRALAEHRGCSVGLPHAEAFEVVRSIA
jgi:LmbE family N-acetylglucosaminyl deacetylase